MADTKISGLTALTGANTASGDLLTIVDVSDTTMAATGTNKKITLTELQGAPVSAGTANGVLYLNGSKVATSGSALAFDGTNLGIGISPSAWTNGPAIQAAGFGLQSFSSTLMLLHQNSYYNSGTGYIYRTTAAASMYAQTGGQHQWYNAPSGTAGNAITYTQAMTLDASGNLGIGTSSPVNKFVVSNSGAMGFEVAPTGGTGSTPALYSYNRSGAAWATLSYFANQHLWNYAGTSLGMTLDASGNLGLGVTPSDWSGFKVLESTSGNSIYFGSTQASIGSNAYNDGFGWKYKTTAAAGLFTNVQGVYSWYNAPSGTAGNAITLTQAMTLDASGYLLIGTTNNPASAQMMLTKAGGAQGFEFLPGSSTSVNTILHYNRAGSVYLTSNTNALDHTWQTSGTERARIDSSGNLIVNGTAAGVVNNNAFWTSTSAYFGQNHESGTASGTNYAYFAYNAGTIGSITQSGTTAVAYNTSSDYRLKDNPQPLTGSGAFIDALKPKTWNWKTDGSLGVGFIAHEVQEVSPNSVVGQKDAVDEDGKPIMQAMEYGSAEFIANIIAELQSLRARVAALES